MNWKKIFYDNSLDFSKVESALLTMSSHNINVALYNFPYCTVPRVHRKFAKISISDWKKKFIDACNKCDQKERCCGFFEWHKNEIGYNRLGVNYL